MRYKITEFEDGQPVEVEWEEEEDTQPTPDDEDDEDDTVPILDKVQHLGRNDG